MRVSSSTALADKVARAAFFPLLAALAGCGAYDPGGSVDEAGESVDQVEQPILIGNQHATLWSTGFTDAQGFDVQASYETFAYPRLNNDVKYDVCGMSPAGITCAKANSAGNGFLAPTVWTSAFNLGAPYYPSFKFMDIDNDLDHDFCERGAEGIWCGKSNGSAFTDLHVWQSFFSDLNGWGSSASYYTTIQYPDINGDSKADVCGRKGDGLWCATSDGNNFGTAALTGTYFRDNQGWGAHKYYSTIQFVHMNPTGDNKIDVCARTSLGIYCGNGNGSTFNISGIPLDKRSSGNDFSDDGGWGNIDHYSTIRFADIDHDFDIDVCGRGHLGFYCAKNNGSGFFSTVTRWTTALSNGAGGDQAAIYKTIMLKDIDFDGSADLCYRGVSGIECGRSTGTSFMTPQLVCSDFSDGFGWNQAKYYSTIELVDVSGDGYPDVCGRGNGVACRF